MSRQKSDAYFRSTATRAHAKECVVLEVVMALNGSNNRTTCSTESFKTWTSQSKLVRFALNL
jgi:hypothetical protein